MRQFFVFVLGSTAWLAWSVEHWTVNWTTWLWFQCGAGHFNCACSRNSFYSHLICTTALACTEVTINSLQMWMYLVLVNCLTTCPRMVRRLELCSGEFNVAMLWSRVCKTTNITTSFFFILYSTKDNKKNKFHVL